MSRQESLIQELDLEPIKFKLVMDSHGLQWTRERADRAEVSYKQFLALVSRYPGVDLVPFGDIDAFWHQHILDTRKYADDCQKIFGYFLHHFPYFGLRGEKDAADLRSSGERTKQLFLNEFGEEMLDESGCKVCGPDPDSCAPIPSCSGEPNPSIRTNHRPRFDSVAAI